MVYNLSDNLYKTKIDQKENGINYNFFSRIQNFFRIYSHIYIYMIYTKLSGI